MMPLLHLQVLIADLILHLLNLLYIQAYSWTSDKPNILDHDF